MKLRPSTTPKRKLRASTLANSRKSIAIAKKNGMLPPASSSTVPPSTRQLRASTVANSRRSLENAIKREEMLEQKRMSRGNPPAAPPVSRTRTRTYQKQEVKKTVTAAAAKKPAKRAQVKTTPRSRTSVIAKKTSPAVLPPTYVPRNRIEGIYLPKPKPREAPRSRTSAVSSDAAARKRTRTSAISSSVARNEEINVIGNVNTAEIPAPAKKARRSRTTAPSKRKPRTRTTAVSRAQKEQEKAAEDFADNGLGFIFRPDTYVPERYLQFRHEYANDPFFNYFRQPRNVPVVEEPPPQPSESSFFGNALEIDQLMGYGFVEDDVNGVYIEF